MRGGVALDSEFRPVRSSVERRKYGFLGTRLGSSGNFVGSCNKEKDAV